MEGLLMSEDMLNVMGSFISTELDAFENLHKELEERDKEIERLNNIINELEKYLEEESRYNEYKDVFYREHMGYVLDKLKELKDSD